MKGKIIKFFGKVSTNKVYLLPLVSLAMVIFSFVEAFRIEPFFVSFCFSLIMLICSWQMGWGFGFLRFLKGNAQSKGKLMEIHKPKLEVLIGIIGLVAAIIATCCNSILIKIILYLLGATLYFLAGVKIKYCYEEETE